MDGRCQHAVGSWARQQFGADYPDTITIAGVDGELNNNEAEWERALRMGKISVEKHGATQACVVGHSGCAGFVASAEEHQEAIRNAVAKLTSAGLYETVVGLYHDVDTDTLTEVCRARGTAVAIPTAALV